MMRILLIILQVFVASFVGLWLAVESLPFTSSGLVAPFSRMALSLTILSRLSFAGVEVIRISPYIVWLPAVTLLLALPQGIRALTPLRWLGLALNLAALAYFYHSFPGILSPGALPAPLAAIAAYFLLNCILLLFSTEGGSRDSFRFLYFLFLLLLWAGSVGILLYGALEQGLKVEQLPGWGASIGVLSLAFWGLAKAVLVGKPGKGNVAVLIFFPLVVLAFACYLQSPLALPLAGGLSIVLAKSIAA